MYVKNCFWSKYLYNVFKMGQLQKLWFWEPLILLLELIPELENLCMRHGASHSLSINVKAVNVGQSDLLLSEYLCTPKISAISTCRYDP